MELVNEFRVPVPASTAWATLTDVERVAPCIPGAQLLSVDGDDFTGAVKVKVGPITVSYKGEATFQAKDEAAQRVVIKANGKETRGSGTAAALVTAQLKDAGSGNAPATHVVITTDLTISGKAAQFGRGVLADVSSHLIEQFAKNMEADLLGGPAAPKTAAGGEESAKSAAPQDNAINSLALAKAVAPSLAKRYAPVLAALGAGLAVGLLVGRRRKPKSPTAAVAEDVQAALARLLGTISS
jgi:carbon monoxide dehydrogenase subunit G